MYLYFNFVFQTLEKIENEDELLVSLNSCESIHTKCPDNLSAVKEEDVSFFFYSRTYGTSSTNLDIYGGNCSIIVKHTFDRPTSLV